MNNYARFEINGQISQTTDHVTHDPWSNYVSVLFLCRHPVLYPIPKQSLLDFPNLSGLLKTHGFLLTRKKIPR